MHGNEIKWLVVYFGIFLPKVISENYQSAPLINSNEYINSLHVYVAATHTWICPSVRGEGPEAREGHSAALVGKRLFIFGGCGKSSDKNKEIYYNDLYILNTGKNLDNALLLIALTNFVLIN